MLLKRSNRIKTIHFWEEVDEENVSLDKFQSELNSNFIKTHQNLKLWKYTLSRIIYMIDLSEL